MGFPAKLLDKETQRRLGIKPRGGRKWKNRPITVENKMLFGDKAMHFHSTGEGKRACNLRMMELNGDIRDLQFQVEFRLGHNGVHVCKYVADFTYWENGHWIVEDFKGKPTPEYKIKAALMLALRGITVRVTTDRDL